jgi:hypothetical protein
MLFLTTRARHRLQDGFRQWDTRLVAEVVRKAMVDVQPDEVKCRSTSALPWEETCRDTQARVVRSRSFGPSMLAACRAIPTTSASIAVSSTWLSVALRLGREGLRELAWLSGRWCARGRPSSAQRTPYAQMRPGHTCASVRRAGRLGLALSPAGHRAPSRKVPGPVGRTGGVSRRCTSGPPCSDGGARRCARNPAHALPSQPARVVSARRKLARAEGARAAETMAGASPWPRPRAGFGGSSWPAPRTHTRRS